MSKFFDLFAKNMRSIIAFLIVLFSFGFLYILMLKQKEIPKENAAILNVAAGVVLTVVSGVVGYYFGSSKDKSDLEKANVEIEKKEAGI